MSFINYIKARLFKVIVIVAVALLIVSFYRYDNYEVHSYEPFFSIKSLRRKMKAAFSENETTFGDIEDSFYNSSQYSLNYISDTSVMDPNKPCPPIPPGLVGAIQIKKETMEMADLEKMPEFEELEPGGSFHTKKCKARDVVALVIPYRLRNDQISVFLYNIHKMLMKQQIDYQIFIVEQYGNGLFNRGKLMNVGFAEANKVKKFDCFIFHDVDLIPEDDRNLYTCPEQPRHMSVAIDKFSYKLPYPLLFGGVCAFTKEHFELVNGFSNSFWGWGGEDDNLFQRLRRKKLLFSRYPPTVARYTMLPHVRQTPNPNRFKVLLKGLRLFDFDGLNSLKYERKAIEFKRLYTWILADINPPR